MISNILAGMTAVHIALAFTNLFGYHPQLWHYFGGTVGLSAMGAGHLLIAAILIVGAYRDRLDCLRMGLLLSVTVYLVQLCLLLAGEARAIVLHVVPPVAWEGPVYTAGLVLLSIAAYRHITMAPDDHVVR
jgi:hypothetical protein